MLRSCWLPLTQSIMGLVRGSVALGVELRIGEVNDGKSPPTWRP